MASFDLSLVIRLIDQFTQPAKKLRDGVGGVVRDISDGFADAIRNGLTDKNLDAAISQAESQLGRAKGRLMGAIGTGIALFAPVKIAADFETAMNQVAALSGAEGEMLDALRDQALELGRTTQFTASQVADAMGFLAMAGFDANQTIAAMPGTLQLAASAQLDMARAADIVTNILTGYGKDISELPHVNDVLVKAFTSANTDLVQLAEAMKYAGPVASAAKVQFEEAAAALALMGNAGIQSSMAGTSLRGAISRILNPSKQMAATMRAAGLDFTDANGRLLPLVDIIQQLEPHADDAGLFMELFGQRAGPAMAALVSQGHEALQELTGELEDSAGTAERIGSVQMQGFNGQMKELTSAIEGAAIALGSMLIPAASELVASIIPAVSVITEWIQANPELARTLLTAVAGLMLFSVASKVAAFAFSGVHLGALRLINTFLRFDSAGKNVAIGWRVLTSLGGVLGGAFALIKTAAIAVGGALAGISAPVWGVIAVLAAAAFAIWKFWDRISSFVSGMAEGLGEVLGPAVAGIGEAINGLLLQLAALFGLDEEQVEGFKAGISEAFAGAFAGIGDLVEGAKEMLAGFWEWLGGFFQQETLTDEQKAEMKEAGRKLITDMFEGIKAGAVAMFEWFRNLPGLIAAAIGSIDIGALIQWPQPPEWLTGWFGGPGDGDDPPPGMPPLEPGGGGFRWPWQGPEEINATIAAEVVDRRPPEVTVHAPITITGVADPRAAAAAAGSELAGAINQASNRSMNDGMP